MRRELTVFRTAEVAQSDLLLPYDAGWFPDRRVQGLSEIT
jgi:hypothetical protein